MFSSNANAQEPDCAVQREHIFVGFVITDIEGPVAGEASQFSPQSRTLIRGARRNHAHRQLPADQTSLG